MNRSGFTLIEIIIGISIIAIIGAIGLISLNPASNISRSNNNQRSAAVNSIITAVGRRIADNRGRFETSCAAGVIPSTPTNIGANFYNIEPCLVPIYLQKMPLDPNGGTSADTKYQISQDANGRVTVSAPQAELGATISVTR